MPVFGVLYRPDFNEELHSLHTTREKAEAAMRQSAIDWYGPWTPSSGWDTEDAMVYSYLSSREFCVREVEVK